MATATDNQINVLNDLIEVTLDSVKGYEDAAEQARSDKLKAIFTRRASQRRSVVSELQQLVRTLGGTPEDDSSILAKAHRAFLNLKNAVTGQSDTAVLEEVERGEDHLKNRWERALNEDLPADLRQTLVRLYNTSVKPGHDDASELKHAAQASR